MTFRTRFDEALELHEQERHARILGGGGGGRARLRLFQQLFPRHNRDDGFVPLVQAAEIMATTADDVAQMALRGQLEWRKVGDTIRVKPAIVSVLGVRAA